MNTSGSSADRVAAILTAAEETAERIRAEAEERMRARIAEGDRAADNRVRAAEDEAFDILAIASAEAERLSREVRTQAESRALEIVARAEDEAAKRTSEAEARAKEMLREARSVAGAVKIEGTELSEHIRELADSLRLNANRLLHDVLDAHVALGAALDRADGGAPQPAQELSRPPAPMPATDFDVPEFVPGRR